jgi:Uma2 family endonuclease
MNPTATTRATLDDLMAVEGKAELIGGSIVRFMASGFRPSRVAARIYKSLDRHAETVGVGVASPDGLGYAVPELGSGRESFEPDASYYRGPMPANDMRFISGPPTFAVEVRSENDQGPAAEVAIAAKRADYFEAGTLVVWDVDPELELVHAYRYDNPTQPQTFRRGDVADAEPAVPGWTMRVDDVFGS